MIARLSCRKLCRRILQKGFPTSLVGEEGPDHDKSFQAVVKIGEEEYGSGKGRTKKAAEQKAAYQAILALHNKKYKVGAVCI